MKRLIALLMALMMITSLALAETTGDNPPEKPEGQMGEMGNPGEKPDGQPGDMNGNPPEKPDGQSGDMENPPEKPDGQPGEMGGAPDGQPGGMGGPGMGSASIEYTAVQTVTEDTELTGELKSTGTDENVLLVTSGTTTVSNADVQRYSADSTGGDNSSFYGVGACLLVTGGTLKVTDSTIAGQANGAAGVFAYGDGTAYVSNTTITTSESTSGGIHVAGGGTLYATDLTVETSGASSAAIRSDRGSGTMVVEGGTYTSNGSGSPAVYVTADISIKDAELNATGAEALCLEGKNSVRLYNCSLTGNMPDNEQNDNNWNVILYQSMSGDSEVGQGSFQMIGGTLTAQRGGMFYTTNTDSVFVLSDVEIIPSDTNDYFLRCTGNSNARGWGQTGSNGADCTFVGYSQEMNGNVIYDSISNLNLYLMTGSVLTGAVLDDESCAGQGGDGKTTVYIDQNSTWVVTEDSTLDALMTEGTVVDSEGNPATIVGTDGTVYQQGSAFTVTVNSYSDTPDFSGAVELTDWTGIPEA